MPDDEPERRDAAGPPVGPGGPAVGEGPAGMVWPIRRSTRPSLDTLQYDQRQLIYSGDASRSPPLTPLIERFRSRRDLINWYQAGVVRTFGHLSKEWPPHDLVRDQALIQALCQRDADDADEHHLWLHTRVVEAVVLPACGTAYRHLRDKSAERTSADRYGSEDDWDDIEPEEEHYIGMRPAYSLLDAEQSDALAELWGGFDARRQVGEWLHSLHAATWGTYGAAEAADILADEYACAMFQDRSREGRIFRERFAATELLPAFAEAASRLQAGEQHDTEPDNTWREG